MSHGRCGTSRTATGNHGLFASTGLLQLTLYGCGGVAAWRAGTSLNPISGEYDPSDIFKMPGAKVYNTLPELALALIDLGKAGGLSLQFKRYPPVRWSTLQRS